MMETLLSVIGGVVGGSLGGGIVGFFWWITTRKKRREEAEAFVTYVEYMNRPTFTQAHNERINRQFEQIEKDINEAHAKRLEKLKQMSELSGK